MEIKDKLQKLIQDKKSRIAVIGMGYVGLPLALRFESQGFSVIGIDTDKDKVKLLNQGSSPIEHIKSSILKKALSRNLSFSSDYKLLQSVFFYNSLFLIVNYIFANYYRAIFTDHKSY